jgi:gluconate 2-dehydrogenase gamma chain
MSETMNRREAVKAFAIASIAGTLELSPAHVERAFVHMESLAVEPEQQQPAYAPKFFTRSEWPTLRMLVDYIIPRDAKSGSATDAKVPEFMDFLLADREASVANQVAVRGGLAWLDRESRDRFGSRFVTATDAQRRQILDDIAWPAKARPEMSQGVAFFTRMRDFTASGFYSSAMGWKDLDFVAPAAHPHWDGCPPAALQKLGVSYDLMDHRPNKG